MQTISFKMHFNPFFLNKNTKNYYKYEDKKHQFQLQCVLNMFSAIQQNVNVRLWFVRSVRSVSGHTIVKQKSE